MRFNALKARRPISILTIIILVVSSIMGAVLTAPVIVFAISAGGIKSTIASIIMSLFLQTGVAPVNQTWVNTLNASYGYTIETAISEGLLTETASGLIDTGLASSIESATAYSELGLSEIFTTTVADVGVTAASGGVNIATTAINVGTAGTIGAFAGAVGIGVGVGILINHVREKYGPYIRTGLGLDASTRAKNFIATTGSNGRIFGIEYSYGSDRYYGFTENNVFGIYYKSGSSYFWGIFPNSNNLPSTYVDIYPTNEYIMVFSSGGITGSTSQSNSLVGYSLVNNSDEFNRYKTGVASGSVEEPKLKNNDLIGNLGNQYYDAENDTYPGITNIIPDGSDMVPVDMDDYQDFMDNANNNTDAGDTGEESNGDLFSDFIDPYIVDAPTLPDEPIIPDNSMDVPVVPERPLVPDQPVMPAKPDLTPEEIQEGLNGATTIDLRSVFPFCIPFDLYNIVKIFDSGENRQAPHISFTFPGTDWVIDVDLSVFDPVAGILRLLELILFIIGLAVATRSLIGAGGG